MTSERVQELYLLLLQGQNLERSVFIDSEEYQFFLVPEIFEPHTSFTGLHVNTLIMSPEIQQKHSI